MVVNPQENTVKERASLESQKENLSKKTESAKEVQEATVGKEAYREAVGFDETVETTGRVSEVIREKGEQKGDTTAGGTVKATKKSAQPIDPDEIRAKLLKSVPRSEKVMRRQIESEINDEITYLHKKAVKLMALPTGMSFFEMSNLMKKIRELKGILIKLVKASIENLKTLWLRFVHGVM